MSIVVKRRNFVPTKLNVFTVLHHNSPLPPPHTRTHTHGLTFERQASQLSRQGLEARVVRKVQLAEVGELLDAVGHASQRVVAQRQVLQLLHLKEAGWKALRCQIKSHGHCTGVEAGVQMHGLTNF